jgi:hypothetical protein
MKNQSEKNKKLGNSNFIKEPRTREEKSAALIKWFETDPKGKQQMEELIKDLKKYGT